MIGLPLLLLPSLPAVLVGLALVGVGTFFAQACATGYVSRTATSDRASASGIYLASYFFGGLVGSAVLGQIFDRFGWAACVAGIGVSLVGSNCACRPAQDFRSTANCPAHRRDAIVNRSRASSVTAPSPSSQKGIDGRLSGC